MSYFEQNSFLLGNCQLIVEDSFKLLTRSNILPDIFPFGAFEVTLLRLETNILLYFVKQFWRLYFQSLPFYQSYRFAVSSTVAENIERDPRYPKDSETLLNLLILLLLEQELWTGKPCLVKRLPVRTVITIEAAMHSMDFIIITHIITLDTTTRARLR